MTEAPAGQPTSEARAAELRLELDRLRYTLDTLGAGVRVTQRMKIQQVERELRALAATPAAT